MASTATGSRGKPPRSQLKGAVAKPQPTMSRKKSTVMSLFSRKYLTARLIMISRRLNEKASGLKPKEIHTKLVGHKLSLELNQEGLVE